jgi:hypothetical protein
MTTNPIGWRDGIDEHYYMLARRFYERIARLAGLTLEQSLRGTGPGMSPAFRREPIPFVTTIRPVDPQHRRTVVEEWTIPDFLQPCEDGERRRLTPRELTLVSLMLGAQPIQNLEPDTTPRDVYRAEKKAVKAAIQNARRRSVRQLHPVSAL